MRSRFCACGVSWRGWPPPRSPSEARTRACCICPIGSTEHRTFDTLRTPCSAHDKRYGSYVASVLHLVASAGQPYESAALFALSDLDNHCRRGDQGPGRQRPVLRRQRGQCRQRRRLGPGLRLGLRPHDRQPADLRRDQTPLLGQLLPQRPQRRGTQRVARPRRSSPARAGSSRWPCRTTTAATRRCATASGTSGRTRSARSICRRAGRKEPATGPTTAPCTSPWPTKPGRPR